MPIDSWCYTRCTHFKEITDAFMSHSCVKDWGASDVGDHHRVRGVYVIEVDLNLYTQNPKVFQNLSRARNVDSMCAAIKVDKNQAFQVRRTPSRRFE